MTTEPQSAIFAGRAGQRSAAMALNYYGENYDAIFTKNLTAGSRCVLGTRLPRVCRFCGEQSPKVNFRSEAHAISALTGNNTLFTYEECSDCNTRRFSSLEDDLAKFTLPARLFAQIAGRNGIPKATIPTGRMEMRDSVLTVKLDRDAIDITFTEDPVLQTVTVSVPLQPYRPLAVYKALLKMALTVAPQDELGAFGTALQWLNSDGIESNMVSDCFGFRCIQTYGTKVYRVPTVRLLRRKPTSTARYATFILGFGSGTYQIFLPGSDNDVHLHGRDIALQAFPPVQMIFGDSPDDWAKFEVSELSSSSRVRGAIWKVGLTYQRREVSPGTV